MTRGVFVTGTDTGVGKTFASCVLIHALAARGLRVAAMKPVAAGSDEDTLALMRAARIDASRRSQVTPVLLREAIAPHIAGTMNAHVTRAREIVSSAAFGSNLSSMIVVPPR